MPRYEYRCESCGADHDVWHGINETVSVTCCKRQRLKKLVSTVQILVPEEHKATFKPSPNHMKWLQSDATQAKLKSGELEMYKPSRDDP